LAVGEAEGAGDVMITRATHASRANLAGSFLVSWRPDPWRRVAAPQDKT